jgi:hypothetical protein
MNYYKTQRKIKLKPKNIGNLGDPFYFLGIFARKKKNISGNVSIQILVKVNRKNK